MSDTPTMTPQVAQKGPYAVNVELGRTYYWCTCGRSATQPYCDGAHKGTGLEPMPYKADQSGEVWLCGCKQSKGAPFCDGSHEVL